MNQQECQERIDYWNSKGLRKSKPNTKVHKLIIERIKESINGTGTCVGKKIPISLFKLSVDRFAFTVFDPKFRPISKNATKRMSLADFIWNQFQPAPKFYNSLIYYSENIPEPIDTIQNYQL